MCGIVALLDLDGPDLDRGPADPQQARRTATELAKRIRHRGPDWSGLYQDNGAVLAHERLAIVDVEHGAQPLVDRRTGAVLAVNGEIYNHKALQHQLKKHHEFATESDCEVLLYLADEEPPAQFLPRVGGIFAFVLWHPTGRYYLIARDAIGVIPLYYGFDGDGRLCAASELKGLLGHCDDVHEFPPGFYLDSRDLRPGAPLPLQQWYKPTWAEPGYLPTTPYDPQALRQAFEAAVHRQLMCDVPYGVLISGGVDSSLVAATAARYAARRVESEDQEPAWWPRLHSFAVGLDGAPDFGPARHVAQFIGSVHHEVHFTLQEGLDALYDVIGHLETFDVTTIRAGTPMYLLMRRIKSMGIKMVLSGEGADEIFGGYLYFHKAPNAAELHAETVRKLAKLHKYDCLRANKAGAAWGVEVRVPFLDPDFLDVAMQLDPAIKLPYKAPRPRPIEKYPLRQAFQGAIPDAVLWRQKEQFSDGVGYGWIGGLRAHAEQAVSDAQLAAAAERFPVKTPETKEAYLYRELFERQFPGPGPASCVAWEKSVACSTAIALEWDAAWKNQADPSGRAVRDVHDEGHTL